MEGIKEMVEYFNTYGILLVFAVVYLEYLNLPGLPAGIIMPAAGVLIAQSEYNFIWVLIVSVTAGTIGSICLYYVGYFVGNPVLNWMYEKFPKSRSSIEKAMSYQEKYGNRGAFISRLVPVARTLISLISGIFRTNIFKFTLYSIPGITIWNFVFILSGYLGAKIIF